MVIITCLIPFSISSSKNNNTIGEKQCTATVVLLYNIVVVGQLSCAGVFMRESQCAGLARENRKIPSTDGGRTGVCRVPERGAIHKHTYTHTQIWMDTRNTKKIAYRSRDRIFSSDTATYLRPTGTMCDAFMTPCVSTIDRNVSQRGDSPHGGIPLPIKRARFGALASRDRGEGTTGQRTLSARQWKKTISII